MRAPVIALLCGLAAAAAALLVWQAGGEDQVAQPTQPTQTARLAPAAISTALPSSSLLPGLPATAAVAGSAVRSAGAVAGAATRPPPQAAIPVRSGFALSSDHQALIHDTVLAAADHQLLEREPRDDAWATEAERLIRQALARHGKAGDFDVIAVDCRETLCAIQAFSYGVNGHREWVNALDELYKQTLASRFDSVNTAFPTQGSRSPVLSFLHRKSVDAKP